MLNVQDIPLSKLVPSSANVRKSGRGEGIKELAASIKAHGLLQNLTVRKGEGDHAGRFEVVAGGRRLAALQRLASKKELAASTRIPCHVIAGDAATEISLAENVGQCPMHPADQYAAFAKLHVEEGMPAADIAARFGVSEAVVKQRLKLGSVSPRLIKRYREGEMTLEQLTAFTITDDHKAQERVWRELPAFNNDRRAILEALTEAKVASDDRRALFVGIEAYQKAGGTLTRDLFGAEGECFLDDPALLNTLARDKLQKAARKVIAEGWKWVSVETGFDHGGAAQLRRVHARLSPEDQEKLAVGEAKRDEMWESEEGPDSPKDLEAMEDEIAAIEKRATFMPDDIARAGAFVCLGHDGDIRIERGYLRKEDEADTAMARNDEEEADEEAAVEGPKPLSDKLVMELTAYRTAALRNEVASSPATGLLAVVHALAAQCFYQDHEHACLTVRLTERSLHPHAPEIGDSLAAQMLRERQEKWGKSLPESVDSLWDYVGGLDQEDRLALLALCVALSIDAVHDAKSNCAPADALASALKLDMTRYWQPTAANYFTRVSKERVLEALREAGLPEAADNLAGLKKQAMAEGAEQRLAGKGWLPAVLRTR
jgi:ParB family chromosome partitioning protein